MEAQIFAYNYEGTSITFEKNGQVMVNATDMAKPFGKQPAGWLRSQSSVEFIKELSAMRNCIPTDLVKAINGGSNFGTWMHEDVAIEFARWLSPKFAIWCNDRIKELVRHGFTATVSKINELISNPDLIIGLATQLKEEREQNLRAIEKIENQKRELQRIAPKVKYFDEVLGSENTFTSTTIAKELGMSAIEFHKRLHKMGYIFFHDNHWILYSKYQNMGLSKTKTHTYETTENGRTLTKTTIQTVWTQKGRNFFHALLNPKYS